jgi:hypothetical protein
MSPLLKSHKQLKTLRDWLPAQSCTVSQFRDMHTCTCISIPTKIQIPIGVAVCFATTRHIDDEQTQRSAMFLNSKSTLSNPWLHQLQDTFFSQAHSRQKAESADMLLARVNISDY